MDYRTSDEIRYFGSDLNKFINECCSKQMTAINIDLLLYKRSNKHIRIIESKHSKENVPPSQREILRLMAKLFGPIAKHFNHCFEVFIVRGDFPYDKVSIENMYDGEIYTIDNCKLKNWLEFTEKLGKE